MAKALLCSRLSRVAAAAVAVPVPAGHGVALARCVLSLAGLDPIPGIQQPEVLSLTSFYSAQAAGACPHGDTGLLQSSCS